MNIRKTHIFAHIFAKNFEAGPINISNKQQWLYPEKKCFNTPSTKKMSPTPKNGDPLLFNELVTS